MKPKKLVHYAKANRRKRTPAEAALFKHLQRWGFRFRSQRYYGCYIVDFLILKKWLVIEVDGSYHNTVNQKLHDATRTKYLESIGLTVIRFTNSTVFGSPKLIEKAIRSYPDRKTEYPYIQAEY